MYFVQWLVKEVESCLGWFLALYLLYQGSYPSLGTRFEFLFLLLIEKNSIKEKVLERVVHLQMMFMYQYGPISDPLTF